MGHTKRTCLIVCGFRRSIIWIYARNYSMSIGGVVDVFGAACVWVKGRNELIAKGQKVTKRSILNKVFEMLNTLMIDYRLLE